MENGSSDFYQKECIEKHFFEKDQLVNADMNKVFLARSNS
jgi:hypothetical protein